MFKTLAEGFGRDVIAVARKGEASPHQMAKDLRTSERCLHRWLKIADRYEGITLITGRPANTESVELREARKRITML